ncbi:MAG TPA: 4Fe-4S cluster-binding domain-containing protein [Bacteroidales bacterium]|nr:4Fe-4S cluster-binding domain-containing protein [Bacteroidales bacterium]
MMKKSYDYDIILHWEVTNYCNFSCPGCCGSAKKIDRNYTSEIINIAGLKRFLALFQKPIKIIFSGGEPLLVENIIEVFEETTKSNYITLMTNLTSPKVKELSDRINPERVVLIKASAHIDQLEKRKLLNTYFSNYKLLQDKGFEIYAQEIAYPVLAKKAEKYRKIFLDHGIEMKFQAYRGVWNTMFHKKKYPDSYTKQDYKIFNFTKTDCGATDIHYRKNTLCNAGYNVIVAHPNGNLCPCYGLYTQSIGNIYTGYTLNNSLIRCPLDYCDCPMPLYHPEIYERAVEETSGK